MVARRVFFGLMCLSLYLITASPVSAFSISPLRYTVDIDAGKTRGLPIKIVNSELEKKTYHLKVVGVRQDEFGHPIFGTEFDPAEKWVVPEKSFIQLEKNESATVFFNLVVPAGANPGAHYLGLAAESDAEKGTGNTLTGRLVTLLIVRVAGKVQEGLEVRGWQAPAVTISGRWPIVVSFFNAGTVAVPLSGEVVVQNWYQKELLKKPLVLGNNLVPGAFRKVESVVDAGAVLHFPAWYKITGKISYGQTKQVVKTTATLWYFPVWFCVSLFVVGCGLIWLVISRIRKRKSQKISKQFV